MNHERTAIALYAVAARDPVDFLDMLDDEPTEVLVILEQMLASPGGPNTDRELNALLLGPVRRHLAKRAPVTILAPNADASRVKNYGDNPTRAQLEADGFVADSPEYRRALEPFELAPAAVAAREAGYIGPAPDPCNSCGGSGVSHYTEPCDDCAPDPFERFETTLEALLAASNAVARDRSCASVLAVKLAAIDYVITIAEDTVDPWERIPDNLLAKLRERVEDES